MAASSSSSSSQTIPSSFFGSARPPIIHEFELYQDYRAISITNTLPAIKRVWTASIVNYVPVARWDTFARWLCHNEEGFQAIEKEFQQLMTKKLEEQDREKAMPASQRPKGITLPLSIVAERVAMELLFHDGLPAPPLSAWPESEVSGRDLRRRARGDAGRRISWSPFTTVFELQDSLEDRFAISWYLRVVDSCHIKDSMWNFDVEQSGNFGHCRTDVTVVF